MAAEHDDDDDQPQAEKFHLLWKFRFVEYEVDDIDLEERT